MEGDPKGVDVRTLTVSEVASALRCDRKAVMRMISDGDLPALRSGRIVRISARALEKALGAESTKNEAMEVCGEGE